MLAACELGAERHVLLQVRDPPILLPASESTRQNVRAHNRSTHLTPESSALRPQRPSSHQTQHASKKQERNGDRERRRARGEGSDKSLRKGQSGDACVNQSVLTRFTHSAGSKPAGIRTSLIKARNARSRARQRNTA
eukprot:1422450-Rhodomonas_salina.1